MKISNLILALAVLCSAAVFAEHPTLVFKNQFGEQTNATVLGGSFGAPSLASVTLSSAQVAALNSAQIQLIPAASGKTLRVGSCKMQYTKGSSVFVVGTGSDVIGLRYHSSNIAVASVLETGFLDQSSDKLAVTFGGSTGGVGIQGEAVEVFSNAADVSSGGTSSVAVSCYYGAF